MCYYAFLSLSYHGAEASKKAATRSHVTKFSHTVEISRRENDVMIVRPIFLLFTQLQRFGLDRIPPISLMIGIVNAIVLFILEQVPLHEVCLNPHAIINFGDYHRLVLSAFFHADTWHFYHNMVTSSRKPSVTYARDS